MSRSNPTPEIVWTTRARRALAGRSITDVRYLKPREAEALGWDSRGAVIVLDNGHLLWPAADDEGNGAGALFTSFDDLPTLPILTTTQRNQH